MTNNASSSNKNKKGINFISPVFDRLSNVLQWSLTYGLALTGIIVLAIIGLSGYEYSLEKKLQGINTRISTAVAQLENTTEFENKFLATQEKLELYTDINANEKMADLFPKLSALIPEGVQLKDLIIQPDSVEIVSYAADQSAVAIFANNLKLVNNSSFEDGQKLTVGNPNVREIAKSAGQVIGADVPGYTFALTFNYSIE